MTKKKKAKRGRPSKKTGPRQLALRFPKKKTVKKVSKKNGKKAKV